MEIEDIKQRRDQFTDCSRCERVTRFSALWPENVDAWDCYQALSHRTVRDIQAGTWMIDRFTAGWSWARTADLLRRVDRILEILAPPTTERTENHSRRAET
jgi:hypothetical protein